MYLLLGLSLVLMLLARGDFLGILLAIYIFILFIFEGNYESTTQLKKFITINFAAVIYDLVWIIIHYGGYWGGNKYEQAEMGLKKWTYAISFIIFIVKVTLLVSVWIHYDQLASANKGRKSVTGRKSKNIL
jgi:hypothetical protein